MYDVIKEIVDDGYYFPIKPKWAKKIVTDLPGAMNAKGGWLRC
jgi:acetyl-CoA carboxylase carboxyltransferase component